MTANPATNITRTSATLSGTFTPSRADPQPGESVTYHFEYGTSGHYGSYSMSTPDMDAGSGSTPITVTETITGLKPGTTYHWRLSAESETVGILSADHQFTTHKEPAPPPPPLPAGFQRVHSPSPAGTSSLNSVSCGSPTDCMSVGTTLKRNHFRSIVERWHGGAWHLVGAPVPRNRELLSVSCPRPSNCLAVGDANVRWTGRSWKRLRAPRLPGGSLLAVDCTSARNCWASGLEHGGTSREVAVFAHWRGHSWSVHPAPKPSLELIESISCSSGSNCWAMGSKFVTQVHQPWIADHWNGRRWSRADLPSSGPFQGTLAVSCHRASACWAVGSDSHRSPVALHFLHGKWQRVATEVPKVSYPPHRLFGPQASASFSGVSCPTSRDCWAVGAVNIGNVVYKTLAEHWTGKAWSVVNTGYAVPIAAPHLPVGRHFAQTQLNSVSCPSTSACFAVGSTSHNARSGLRVGGSTLAEVLSPAAAH